MSRHITWWRMQDLNLRSIPRLIYSQLPLATRAIRQLHLVGAVEE